MIAHPWSRLGRIAVIVVIAGVAAGAGSEELVDGRLEIGGAVLNVSPDLQEVRPGTPTVGLTALGRLDAGRISVGLGLGLRLGSEIFTSKRLQFAFRKCRSGRDASTASV